MNILILGAGGFIGTNLTIKYCSQKKHKIIAFDLKEEYLKNIKKVCQNNVTYLCGDYTENTFDDIVKNVDVVYHLVSTTTPATSNKSIENDFSENVIMTIKLLEACARHKVKKVVFISSGGAVYGSDLSVPLKENASGNPISSYGIQKITIEKLLYLYNYLYGLDYRVIRLANPYGPFQRPNGKLGVITTFIDDIIKGKTVTVYGNGEVVRDFIYIEDAIDAIVNICAEKKNTDENEHKIFNVGSGKGLSINEVIKTVEMVFDKKVKVEYIEGRKSDVPVNYLDISLYESIYGKLVKTSLEEGIIKTKEYLEKKENIR